MLDVGDDKRKWVLALYINKTTKSFFLLILCSVRLFFSVVQHPTLPFALSIVDTNRLPTTFPTLSVRRELTPRLD